MNKNLKHASDKELLTELSQRIDNQKIKWGFTYLYNLDKTEMRLICKNEDNWTFTFTQPTLIENSYFVRKVYQQFAPILNKIEAKEQTEQTEQTEQENKTYEALRTELEKKKKQDVRAVWIKRKIHQGRQ